MNRDQARDLITQTFTHAFDKARFGNLAVNLLNRIDDSKAFARNNQYIKDAFKDHVDRFERLGTYTSPDNEKIDVLIVHLTKIAKIERARTAIRNFVADHLKERDGKEAALVAFVSPTEKQWRFSYVKMEYATVEKDSGKVGVETRITPARRFSYLVGEGESCHTAQTRFLTLLQDTATDPTLTQIEEAFSVEAVSDEFFKKYSSLFEDTLAALEKLVAKDKTLRDKFKAKGVNTVDFAKKLMGQIVFLYFLQKKGWLGVAKGEDWGTGPRDFLRRLALGEYGKYGNFFNDVLEPLFYDTLATDRGHEAWCNRFKCRIPFLNGGLFEPLGDYDWKKTDIILPNKLFTNGEFVEEGITGTGVLDVFDRYNFTVNEAEPLEKEVAIDPEMLGKVFENLIEANRRKGLGSYYTPRDIVHYMCQESLINYIDTAVNNDKKLVPRAEIETFIHLGEQISHYEAVEAKYAIKMPKNIEQHARLIDEKLADITICDPAVGSGAFPVGMMTDIVRARSSLTPYFNDVCERTPYHFKRHAIQNSLYGVDIDASAVEIAKLRLWLSLVVDEEDVRQIKPLPNLDYKIVQGNSLIELLSSQSLVSTVDQRRTELVKELKKAKDELFNVTDSTLKDRRRHEIEILMRKLFEYDRDIQIKGMEADILAVKSQIRLSLFEDGKDQKEDEKKIQEIDNKIKEIKNIDIPGPTEHFEWHINFSEIFQERNGFAVVIANPPYIFARESKKKGLKDEDKVYFYEHYELAEYQVNLYPLFMEKGTRLLQPGGCLCFITPNNWLTINTNKAMRKFVLEKSDVAIVNYYARVFVSADVDSAIVVFRNSTNNPVVQLFEYTDGLHFIKAAECGFFLRQREHIINIEAFKAGGTAELMQKIEFCSIRLGEIADVKVGLGAYGIGRGVPPQTEKMIRERIYHSKHKASSQYFKYIDGRDVSRYRMGWSGEYLKYGDHLREPRRDWRLFSTIRILVRQIPSKPPYCIHACLTDETILNDRNSMNIINIREKPEYVLGVLNSRIVSWWFVHKFGKMQRGTFPQFKVNELADFPMPKDGSKHRDEIATLASKILAAKKDDPETDTSPMERRIDRLVYNLYGIDDPTEIALIEGAEAAKLDFKHFLLNGGLATLSSKRPYFSHEDVKAFLPPQYADLKPETLNSYLTELVQAKNLFSAGRGWYSRIADPYQLDRKPVQEVVTAMEKQYPLLAFTCWSTEQVKTHMHHLLNRFVTFVFTESDAMSTLYEFLRDSGYDAWLNPRGKESRRFSVGEKTIVIRRNITEEPVQGHYAAIEKILVDLYVEAENLNLMDRDEYQRMQKNAIESGRVEVATMIRYAKRRKLAPTDASPWIGSITGTY